MSGLSKLFRKSATRPTARRARLGVEAMGDRVVPSVTFTENPGENSLTIVAAANQNNTITIRNDGAGNLTVSADGVTRNFTQIEFVDVETGNGQDTVTYNQGTATQSANITRSFNLDVDLGSSLFDGSAANTFRANVFGDVGFVQNGTVRARDLSFDIWGGNGGDRLDFNFNDTDVRAGSELFIFAIGFGGADNITLDSDGEVDGNMFFTLQGWGGNDTIAANVLLDAGSTGLLGREGTAANIRGDEDSDNLRLAVRQQAGSQAEVDAALNGGFSLFDNDIGRHTTNVSTSFLEQDIVIV